jgi:hypothetical protein
VIVAADPTTELRTVSLVGFPLDVFMRSRQHSEALLREFAFVVDGGGDNTELPRQLLTIVTRVRARAAGLNTGAERLIETAIARGESTVDFDLVIPARIAAGAREFETLLEEVDAYCRSGELLTLASTPELQLFRRWYLREIASQAEGRPPTPWSVFAEDAENAP